MLVNSFFKLTDKMVSSVTHRTCSCVNKEKPYLTYNLSNITNWLTVFYKKFCDLLYDYINCYFGIKIWSFAHKKTSKNKDNIILSI